MLMGEKTTTTKKKKQKKNKLFILNFHFYGHGNNSVGTCLQKALKQQLFYFSGNDDPRPDGNGTASGSRETPVPRETLAPRETPALEKPLHQSCTYSLSAADKSAIASTSTMVAPASSSGNGKFIKKILK